MKNPIVMIRRKEGGEIKEVHAIMSIIAKHCCDVPADIFFDKDKSGKTYFVAIRTKVEDDALYVYAKAKRNFDPKKYMVTLELPGKEEKK